MPTSTTVPFMILTHQRVLELKQLRIFQELSQKTTWLT